jgi:NAD(P)-dependent dehydrogenase (short-subunit alcohol dehydrogenase family)
MAKYLTGRKLAAAMRGFGGADPTNKLILFGLVPILTLSIGSAVFYPSSAMYIGLAHLGLGTLMYAKRPNRKFPTAFQIADGEDLTGKVALVTGPTSGIGVETARVLAHHGATVILAARSASKLKATMKDIEESARAAGNKRVDLRSVVMDMNDLDSVRDAAAEVLGMKLPLHYLINNAGIMALKNHSYTKQGIEKQVGVNHVAHHYLTKLLTPKLRESAPSRVVALSSSAHRFLDNKDAPFWEKDDLNTCPYDNWVAYGNSKVSNMLFAREFNEKHASEGVNAYSVMPGGIFTGLQGEVEKWIQIKWAIVAPFLFKSTQQGAATTMHCALKAPTSSGGEYFENCKETNSVSKMEKILGEDASSKLWAKTEALLASKGY